MILMAVDPGLAACGVAMFEFNHRTGESVLLDLSVYTTSSKSTLLERWSEHEEDIRNAMDDSPRIKLGVKLPGYVAIEYPSYPPGASSAVKLFSSFLLFTYMAKLRGIQVDAYTPKSWHQKLGIPKLPTTEERKAAVRGYCERRWERLVIGGYLAEINKSHHEHAYDALAVGATWMEERKAGMR